MSKLDDRINKVLEGDNGGLVMLAVLFVVLLLFATAALGGTTSYVARDRLGNSVRLYDEPCADPNLLAKANEALRPHIKRGTMIYKGKTYGACWLATPDGKVHIIDTEMDVTVVPMEAFKADPGV